MTREKLRNDIKRALVDTWLSAENNTLTEEQRTIAERQVQRLANGVADAVDSYIAEELGRLKSFLVSPGAFTGHFIPTISNYTSAESLPISRTDLVEEIVTIDPGSIRSYTPTSG